VIQSKAFKQLQEAYPSLALAMVHHIVDTQMSKVTNLDWLDTWVRLAPANDVMSVYAKLFRSRYDGCLYFTGHFWFQPCRHRNIAAAWFDPSLLNEDFFARCMFLSLGSHSLLTSECSKRFGYLLEIEPPSPSNNWTGLPPRPDGEDKDHHEDSECSDVFIPKNHGLLEVYLKLIVENGGGGAAGRRALFYFRPRDPQSSGDLDSVSDLFKNSRLEDFCPVTLYEMVQEIERNRLDLKDCIPFEIPNGYFSEIKTEMANSRDRWMRYGPLQCTDDEIEDGRFDPYNAPVTLNGWVTVDGVKHKRVADLVIETAAKLLETLSEQNISSTGIDLLLSAMGYLVAERRKLDFSRLFVELGNDDDWDNFNLRFADPSSTDVSAPVEEEENPMFLQRFSKLAIFSNTNVSASVEKHPMFLQSHFTLPELRLLVDSSYSGKEFDTILFKN
jgi:hypothetical protein